MGSQQQITGESLFRDLFLPLYPEDTRDLARARSEDANPANNPHVLAHLGEAAQVFVGMAPTILGVELAVDDASVHRLSAALTPERRDKLLAMGAKGTADNALFNVVVHGSAFLGACILRHGGEWAVRRPLWESLVRLKSRAGEGELPIFHWWLKSLADDDKASLADRYRAWVEVPCAKPEDLPVIAPPDRSLPKLAKVRYDALYKYIKAHIPELRDLGEAFPSPERFTDFGFEHLNLTLVGGGRMLIMHGPNKDGLHAFWLTKEGFEKSAFWPSDKFPAPMMRLAENGHLEVILSRDGKALSQEILWWGP